MPEGENRPLNPESERILADLESKIVSLRETKARLIEGVDELVRRYEEDRERELSGSSPTD